MKNKRIGQKLLITFSVILVLYGFTLWASMDDMRKNGVNFTDFYEQGYSVVSVARQMDVDLEAAGKNFGYAIMTPDAEVTAQHLAAAEAELKSAEEALAQLEQSFTGDPGLIQECKTYLGKEKSARQELIALINNSEDAEAARIYYIQTYEPYLMQLSQSAQAIDQEAVTVTDEIYAKAQRLVYTTMVFMYAFGAVAAVIMVSMALYITNAIRKPLQEIEKAAKDMAQGNFDINIEYESRDELGSLANSMQTLCAYTRDIIRDMGMILEEISHGNFTVESERRDAYIGEFAPLLASTDLIVEGLTNTMTEINNSADEVSAGAHQMADGSQALSQGSTEQASSIQLLSANINDVALQIQQNAEHAANAKVHSEKSVQNVLESNRQMQTMISAMNNISEKSQEIGKIIKTIDDIAFQTNILALNAAVEAARAGAAGKGFAVVADEVRNLAQKSAEAAASTSKLIEESIQAVEDGTKIADQTAKAMIAVVDGTNHVTQIIEEISMASNAQADAVSQITEGVDQISSVVQTNSATAEEYAATSEELSGQVQLLKNQVSKFRLKNISSTSLSWEEN